MSPQECRATIALATIMACRMLGLFIILPIFSLYLKRIPGATPALIGIAIGIYGLTQACLQIPFGMLSDKIGRKCVIASGLLIFIIGSLIAALATSIEGLIIGRALQGGGAIGSTILATVADVTRDESRTKAMALIGMVIGLSFIIALIIGPLINAWFHLSGIFVATAITGLISLVILYTLMPHPATPISRPEVSLAPHYFKSVIKNTTLLRLDFGIFSLHSILTALFIAIPLVLMHHSPNHHYTQPLFYLIILISAFVVALPLIIWAEKKHQLKTCFIGSITLLTACAIGLILFQSNILAIGIILLFFFAAFTLLEASLPSWLSKIAPLRHKGTAMGIYSSAQFLGIFVGGSLGGSIFSHFGPTGVFTFCALLSLAWLIASITLPAPPYLATIIMTLDQQHWKSISESIRHIAGVVELSLSEAEQTLYIKINKAIITEQALRRTIQSAQLPH